MNLSVRIEEALQRGERPKDIARDLGCARSYISIVRNGRWRSGELTNRQKLRIVFRWGADRCIPSIAKELKIDEDAILKLLEKEGFLGDVCKI